MVQGNIFNSNTLDVKMLKTGDENCPHCNRLMRAYCKTMDRRLAEELIELYKSVGGNRRTPFNPKEVFVGNHNKITDFQKLGYWWLIERTDKGGWWKVTYDGEQFLRGNLSIEKQIWIFNGEKIPNDNPNPEMVHIGNLCPRWQTDRLDYSEDFVLAKL